MRGGRKPPPLAGREEGYIWRRSPYPPRSHRRPAPRPRGCRPRAEPFLIDRPGDQVQQKLDTPGGFPPLVGDAELHAFVLLQQVRRDPPDGIRVPVAVAGPHAALVLAEADVQAPVLAVLDRPVVADQPAQPRRVRRQAGQRPAWAVASAAHNGRDGNGAVAVAGRAVGLSADRRGAVDGGGPGGVAAAHGAAAAGAVPGGGRRLVGGPRAGGTGGGEDGAGRRRRLGVRRRRRGRGRRRARVADRDRDRRAAGGVHAGRGRRDGGGGGWGGGWGGNGRPGGGAADPGRPRGVDVYPEPVPAGAPGGGGPVGAAPRLRRARGVHAGRPPAGAAVPRRAGPAVAAGRRPPRGRPPRRTWPRGWRRRWRCCGTGAARRRSRPG